MVALAVPLLTAIDVVAPTVASATASYSSTVMSANPAAYWRLGDASGSSTAADASGNGHTLTATGVTFGRPGAIVGDSDTAMAVQDNGNESDAVGSFAFTPSAVTAEIWMRTTPGDSQTSEFGMLTALDPTQQQVYAQLGINHGAVEAKVDSAGSIVTSAGNTFVADGAWHQIVLTDDGSALTIYVDGAQDGSSTPVSAIPWPSSVTWAVGGAGGAEEISINGDLDEAAVFDHTLSASDVSSQYQAAGTPTIGCSSSDHYSATVCAQNPVGYWRLGESSNTAPAVDQTSEGDNGAYTQADNGLPTVGVPGTTTSNSNTAMQITDAGQAMTVPYASHGQFATPTGSLAAWVAPNPADTGDFLIDDGGSPDNNPPWDTGAQGRIALKMEGSGDPEVGNYFTAYVKVGTTVYHVISGDPGTEYTGPQIGGGWHYLVVTYDGSTIRLWVDGNQVAHQAASGPLAPCVTCSLDAGAPFNSTRSARENVDEVAVYNRALTAQEIGTVYQAGAPPPASIPTPQTYGAGSCGCSGTASFPSQVSRSSQPDVARGDPVNTATGAFTDQVTDGKLTGLGVAFNMTRSYTSLDTTSGILGRGWSAPYWSSLTIGGSTVTLRAGDGAQVVFTQSGSSYTSPPGIRSVLTSSGGTYTVTNPDGTAMNFNSSGQLTSMLERHNKGLTMTYTSGNLTKITDADGRSVSFSYYTMPTRLHVMTLPGSRTVTYTYTNGNLTDVQDLMGDHWVYGYDPSSNLLTTVKSPRGYTLTTNTYTNGRVTKQVNGRTTPDTTLFSWNGNSSGTGTSTTTDPDGGTWVDVYSGNMLTSVTDPDGNTTSYTYDASGDRTSMTDGRGNVTTYSYDSNGNMLSETDPAGDQESWTYNSLNEPLTFTDFRNNTTQYAYNVYGDRNTVITPMGNKTTATFHANGNIATSVNPLGYATGNNPSNYTTTYGYDPNTLQLTSVTDPLGNETTYGYDSSGRLTSVVDPRGNVSGQTQAPWTTSQTYYANDLPHVTTEPTASGAAGGTITDVYDADGDLTSQSDENNHATTYTYNRMDVRLNTALPSGDTTVNTVDYAGRVLTSTDGNGDETVNTYDDAGNLLTTVRPLGNIAGANAANYTTTYTYNPDNQVHTASTPLNPTTTAVTTTSYDPNGNVSSVEDPNNNTTLYAYNANNQLNSETTPNSHTTQWAYNNDGQVSSVTDANQNQTSYSYAANDKIASITDADNQTTGYSYDVDGRLATKTAPGGTLTTTYGYSPASNLKTVSYSDGTTPTVSTSWNAQNQPYKVVDGTGTETKSFDGAGNLLSLTTGSGKTVGYTYTADNLPWVITYPATGAHPTGRAVTNGYDPGDRLHTVKDWLNHTTTFTDDADSNLHIIAYPNGVTDTRSYDYGDELTGITDTNSTTTLATFGYGYDNDSQLLSDAENLNSTNANNAYTYTNDNQLKTDPTGNYTQDPANELTGLPDGTTLNYDPADELTSTTNGTNTTTYTENSRGDRTAAAPTVGTPTALTYTQADQLATFTKGSATATYKYNGDGLLATATGNTTATYTWDLSNPLPNLLDDNTTSYIYGPAGPIEQVTDSGDTPTYLAGDQQGSTRLLTNASGSQTGSETYTPYGNVASHTGTATSNLGYDGQYTDPTTGYIYLRARYYDPTTAQFLTGDPLVTLTDQPYAYANNDPLAYQDPTGTCIFCVSTLTDVGIGLGVVALAATGVGAVADAGLLAAESAETVSAVGGYVGTVAGGAAAGVDLVTCADSPSIGSCTAAGVGVVTAGLGVAALGAVDAARVGYGAASFALGAGLATWDAGRAAADAMAGAGAC